MRILILADRIPPENRGGAGIVTWRLVMALHAAGHDVHVIAATDGDSFEEIREGVPTYHLHCHYRERWRAWLSLRNPQMTDPLRALYARIEPDVVNGHNVHQFLSYHSLTMAREMGLPAIFSSHDVMPFAYHKLSYFIDKGYCGVRSVDDYRLPPFFNLKQMRLRYNPLRNWRIRRILARDTVLRTAPSQELANAHMANDLPMFTVVHSGIDPDKFQASDATIEALRERWQLAGRKVILFAGRLTPAKGVWQLLGALKRVVKDVPQTVLVAPSSVPLHEQIQHPDYIDLRDKHLVSLGWLAGEELAAAYHLADLIVSPNIIFDTFPLVNLEAMTAGKPVIASCYGGAREAVVDGETGYIVNPFDTADFAEKITRLLQDEPLSARFGAAGRQRLLDNFTIDIYRDEMVALYEQAINGS